MDGSGAMVGAVIDADTFEGHRGGADGGEIAARFFL